MVDSILETGMTPASTAPPVVRRQSTLGILRGVTYRSLDRLGPVKMEYHLRLTGVVYVVANTVRRDCDLHYHLGAVFSPTVWVVAPASYSFTYRW